MGYTTSILGTKDILTTDFTLFDAILIGNGTGAYEFWVDSTSFGPLVDAINNSNKPVIGLGDGGYAFFGKLSLVIGWGGGAHGYDSSIVAHLPHHAIFTTPNMIVLPPDSVIQLYDSACPTVEIWLPTKPPDVEPIGNTPGDSIYYRIIQQKVRYILWGFSDSPGNMTPTGKQVFINVIDYMMKSYTSKSVLFVNAEDNQWGLDFASLLQTHGITTKLTPMVDVPFENFSFYNLIIFDSRKGQDYVWADSATANLIKNSGKPVLAIGIGGSTLFERMGLSINYGDGWDDEDSSSTLPRNTRIYCVDPSMPIFKTPLAIDIPPDSIISIYDHSNSIEEYKPSLNPDAVMIGRQPDDLSHYTITSEGIYYLWGFTNSPWSMTQTGKDLFYNVVVAMTNLVITGMNGHSNDNSTLPREFTLSQNYPNPFNPSTSIEFAVPRSTLVSLKIYDILGREVTTLVNSIQTIGIHTIQWKADGFSSGVYICRMQAGSFSETKKLVLLR